MRLPPGRLRSGPPGERRRWIDRARPRDAAGSTLLALALTAASLMTLDHQFGVLDPVRTAAGEVVGPLQAGAAAATRPVVALPAWFRTRSDLQHDVAALRAANADLQGQLERDGYDRSRLAEYDRLTALAAETGRVLVPARVVGWGPQQSFSRTVTIDAGSRAGVTTDLTVVNGDGLVGRVIRVTPSTATVLLAMDAESVVGGRVGSSLELGFLRGRGVVGTEGRLDLELVDSAALPTKGDVVVTWGSAGGAPYVSGIPVGRVTKAYDSLRDTSRRAVIKPFVDFSALDLVGVVVAPDTDSDRALVRAGGLR
jgi:rod shape-determining protein MreC